jgi:hypothetical protein
MTSANSVSSNYTPIHFGNFAIGTVTGVPLNATGNASQQSRFLAAVMYRWWSC